MKVKKLFQILVIGGAVIAGSPISCGGSDNKTNTPRDGGGGGPPGW